MFSRRAVSIVLFACLLLTVFHYAWVQTASANAPKCDGLMCTKKDDCGSKCFCNNPFGTSGGGRCYED